MSLSLSIIITCLEQEKILSKLFYYSIKNIYFDILKENIGKVKYFVNTNI